MRARILLSLAAVSIAVAAFAAEAPESRMPAVNDYGHVQMDNGGLTMYLMLPNAANGYYRGTRFDWSGVIARVLLKGHTWFGEWRAPHNPSNHDDITGPAEEFGSLIPPLNYPEAAAGDTFTKIGVGELVKPKEPRYSFFTPYVIRRAGEFTSHFQGNSAEFAQDFSDPRGWAYHYVKRIELAKSGPGFTISHRLKNTGTRRLDTDQYCHNFTMIDDAPIGPDYKITLPFEATAKIQRGVAQVAGKEIRFGEPVTAGKDTYMELKGFGTTAADNGFEIRNVKSGAGIRCQGDTPLYDYHFWSCSTATCPEPFVRITLNPGQEKTWKNSYTLSVRK